MVQYNILKFILTLCFCHWLTIGVLILDMAIILLPPCAILICLFGLMFWVIDHELVFLIFFFYYDANEVGINTGFLPTFCTRYFFSLIWCLFLLQFFLQYFYYQKKMKLPLLGCTMSNQMNSTMRRSLLNPLELMKNNFFLF